MIRDYDLIFGYFEQNFEDMGSIVRYQIQSKDIPTNSYLEYCQICSLVFLEII